MDDWSLTQTYRSSAGEVRWDRLGPTDGSPIVLLLISAACLSIGVHDATDGAITTDTQVRNGVTLTMPVVMISTTMPNTPKPMRPASVFSMKGYSRMPVS